MNHQPDHRTYGAFGTGTAGFVVGGVPNVAPVVHHPSVAPPVMPPMGKIVATAPPYPVAQVAPTSPMPVAIPPPVQAMYPLAIPPTGRPAYPLAIPPPGMPAIPPPETGPAPVDEPTQHQPATAKRAVSIHIRGRFPVRALPAPDNAGDDPRRSSIVRPVASDEKAGVRTPLPPSMATGPIGELRAGLMLTPVNAPATQPCMREPRIHEGRDRLPRIGALSAVGRLPDMFASKNSREKTAEDVKPTAAPAAASPSTKSESKTNSRAVSPYRSPASASPVPAQSPGRQSIPPTPVPGSVTPSHSLIGVDACRQLCRPPQLDAATVAPAERAVDAERTDAACEPPTIEPCPILPQGSATSQLEGAVEFCSETPANEPPQPLQSPDDRPDDIAVPSHSINENRTRQIHRPHTADRCARHRRPSLAAVISGCLAGLAYVYAEFTPLRMSAEFEFVRAHRQRKSPQVIVHIRRRSARGLPHGNDHRCPSSPTILVLLSAEHSPTGERADCPHKNFLPAPHRPKIHRWMAAVGFCARERAGMRERRFPMPRTTLAEISDAAVRTDLRIPPVRREMGGVRQF